MLAVLFLLSGASGLVYEVVWTRLLELLFGVAAYAIAAVLTAFMAGLALGGFLGSRWAPFASNPLRIYALLEGVIGLWALLFRPAYRALESSYPYWPAWSDSVHLVLRFGAAFLLMSVPTIAMGATLPFLARFATRGGDRDPERIGWLYGINTVGAVAGVVLSGFVLLPVLGQTRTLLTAAFLNLLLAVAAFLLSFRVRVAGFRDPIHRRGMVAAVPGRHRILAALALSGLCSLSYETLYSRILSLMLGGTVYSFSTMLATFLAGLGLGALIAVRWMRGLSAARAASALVGVLAAAGTSAYGAGYLFEHLPNLYYTLYLFLSRHLEETALVLVVLRGAMASCVMVPVALFLGATFPLALRVLLAGGGDPSRETGRLYAFNTLGCIAGSFLATIVLLPRFGLQGSLALAAGLHWVAAALAWPGSARIAWGAAILAGSAMGSLPRWDPHRLTIGPYMQVDRLGSSFDPARAVEARLKDSRLVFHRDGISTTVTVERFRGGSLVLSSNGKVEASSIGDASTQQLAAHYPMLWFEAAQGRPPRRVALVGLASGITAGAALAHDPGRLDTFELEPSMVEAARLFQEFNFGAMEDVRHRVILDDARHALLRAREPYEVVISEPSNPWISGVSNLFTREFFEVVRGSLAPGGVFAQWIQVYWLSLDDLRCVIRTFASVFPDACVLGIPPAPGERYPAGDLILLGTRSGRPPRLDALEKAMRRARPAEALARIRTGTAARLLSGWRLGPGEVPAFVGSGPFNTDDNMRIEFSAPRSFYRDTYYPNMKSVRDHQGEPAFHWAMSPGQRRRLLGEIGQEWRSYWNRAMAERWIREAGSSRAAE